MPAIRTQNKRGFSPWDMLLALPSIAEIKPGSPHLDSEMWESALQVRHNAATKVSTLTHPPKEAELWFSWRQGDLEPTLAIFAIAEALTW